MSMYQTKKGFSQAKPPKTNRQKFLTGEQVKTILDEVVRENKKFMRRDHCAIFLGYYLGLRVAEAAMLERNTFRDIAEAVAHIRTLKQAARIVYTCRACLRRSRVAGTRAGTDFKCNKCGATGRVPEPRNPVSKLPPEKIPPTVERHVIDYIVKYMLNVMKPGQRWFFETGPDRHAGAETLRRAFVHYAMQAGLDPMYSWHALRHGRGVALWEKFQDPVIVRDMLRQLSINSTNQYLHLSPRRGLQMQEALEADANENNMSANPFGE